VSLSIYIKKKKKKNNIRGERRVSCTEYQQLSSIQWLDLLLAAICDLAKLLESLRYSLR
jgi:hypothetical protein